MTARKLIQNYLAILIAIGLLILDLKYNFSKDLDMGKIMDKSIDVASISFGFLLAVLALLIQGDSPALTRIKDSGSFPQLVFLNKKAVLASCILVIVALLYSGVGVDVKVFNYDGYDIKKLINSLCLSIFVYQLVVVFSFLDIFYFIIKQDT